MYASPLPSTGCNRIDLPISNTNPSEGWIYGTALLAVDRGLHFLEMEDLFPLATSVQLLYLMSVVSVCMQSQTSTTVGFAAINILSPGKPLQIMSFKCSKWIREILPLWQLLTQPQVRQSCTYREQSGFFNEFQPLSITVNVLVCYTCFYAFLSFYFLTSLALWADLFF